MLSRTRALQAFKPAFTYTHLQALRSRPFQLHPRRTFAEKAAPVRSDQPRDWTSRLPLVVLAGVAAFLPFYYFSHTNKPFASGQAERREARIGKDPSKEVRDPRDSSVKTVEQKMKRDGIDLRSESRK